MTFYQPNPQNDRSGSKPDKTDATAKPRQGGLGSLLKRQLGSVWGKLWGGSKSSQSMPEASIDSSDYSAVAEITFEAPVHSNSRKSSSNKMQRARQYAQLQGDVTDVAQEGATTYGNKIRKTAKPVLFDETFENGIHAEYNNVINAVLHLDGAFKSPENEIFEQNFESLDFAAQNDLLRYVDTYTDTDTDTDTISLDDDEADLIEFKGGRWLRPDLKRSLEPYVAALPVKTLRSIDDILTGQWSNEYYPRSYTNAANWSARVGKTPKP